MHALPSRGASLLERDLYRVGAVEVKKLTATNWRKDCGGALMLWTVFTFLVVVGALGVLFHFGGMIIPMVFMLALVVLFLKLVIRRTSFK
jgi:succinate-acetate transporter protein